MRIDVTLRSADGAECDVALLAPPGTTLGELAGLACHRWSGGVRLPLTAVLGGPGLRDGAVLDERGGGAATVADPAEVVLEVVGGIDGGLRVGMRQGPVVAGRDRSCGLRLQDPRVSRRHAVLQLGPEGLVVTDLGSTHGTSTCALRPGVVRLGDTWLALRSELPGTAGAIRVEARRGGRSGGPVATTPGCADDVGRGRPIDGGLGRDGGGGREVGAALLPAAAGLLIGAGGAWLLHEPALLLFAALGPLVSLATALGRGATGRARRRRRARGAAARAGRRRRDLATARALETAERHALAPGPADVLRSLEDPAATLPPSGSPLAVRLGLGDVVSSTTLRDDGDGQRLGTLPDTPVVVTLGAASLAARVEGPVGDALGRWLLLQLAVAGAANGDARGVVLVTDRPAHWHWARWLPGLRLTPPGAGVAPGTGAVLVDGAAQVTGADGRTGPAPTAVIRLHRTGFPGPGTGWQLQAVGSGGRVRLSGGADVAADSRTERELVVDGIDAATAERAARLLAARVAGVGDGDPAVPGRVALRDLLDDACGCGAAESASRRMPGDVPGDRLATASLTRRWGHACVPEAVLGVGNGATVRLDLVRDGPHVLIAGTTGSGKSELLRTLVVGLALACPPQRLTLLLVDFKGGAALARCAALPHCVGAVTDLDPAGARRVLASIGAELRHREAVMAEHGASGIAELPEAAAPPRLVVVVDEFGTLADQLPEFVPGLVALARRGRSLGVHLVLATQRAAGSVSAELRANIAARIALRTVDAADSVDVVEVPDAAALDPALPGRAVARLGGRTVVLQTARVTVPPDADEPRVAPLGPWRALARSASDASPTDPDHDGADATHDDLARIVQALRAAAIAGDARPPRRPWLPALPDRWAPVVRPTGTAPMAVGLVDLPEQQAQPTLDPPGAGECWLVQGRARSGRSTVVRAVVLSRSRATAAPHVHLVSASSQLTGAVAGLPQAGTLAAPGDLDRIGRLAELLLAEAHGPHPWSPLLAVDGWDDLAAASAAADGGRTLDAVAAAAAAVLVRGGTVLVTAGPRPLHRGTAGISPVDLATERFVLPLADATDYALLGVSGEVVTPTPPPGRAVRARDGVAVQFACPDDGAAQSACADGVAVQVTPPHDAGVAATDRATAGRAAGPRPYRVLALPRRVPPPAAAGEDGRLLVGVGGDAAEPVRLRLREPGMHLLLCGPARSGKSTALRALLAQCRAKDVVVLAGTRSPLAAAVGKRSGLLTVADPAAPAGTLLLADDAEHRAEDEDLLGWLAAGRPAVLATTPQAALTAYRGPLAEIRRARTGVLLHPTAADAEVLGVAVPTGLRDAPPGRGVLVGDPAWHPALIDRGGIVPIQLATA